MGEDRLVAEPLLERRGFRTDGPRGRGGVVIRDRFRPYPRIKQLPRERDRGFESAFLQQRVACEPGAYSNKDFAEGFASKFRR